MNISNLLTVSAAATIAVAGTIYSQVSDPVINYYVVGTSGCVLYSTPPGCSTSGAVACTVIYEGVSCNVRRQADSGAPCAVALFKN